MTELFKLSMHSGVNVAELFIGENENVAVFGENGSGKTDVLKAIYKHGKGVVYRNIFKFNSNEKQLFKREIGYFDGSLFGNPSVLVSDFLLDNSHKIGMTVQETMQAFLIPERLSAIRLKDVDYELSQKLSLISVLAGGYKTILFDDVFGIEWHFKRALADTLNELSQRLGLSYIIASADLRFLAALCHSVIVVDDGELIEYGDMKEVFYHARHPYTKWLVNCAKLEKDINLCFVRTSSDEKVKKGCRYASVCPLKSENCTASTPQFTEFDGVWTACHNVNKRDI